MSTLRLLLRKELEKNHHRYIPASHLCEEELELIMDHSDPSHPDYNNFCGDGEFDAGWDLWEQERRKIAVNAIDSSFYDL